jgi:type II secretion system protein N
MKLTFRLPSLSARATTPGAGGRLRALRRKLKPIAIWGLASFLLVLGFMWLSLPTRALAWRIGHECKKRGFIVDVEDISVSPFGGVTLENVQWTFEPSRPGEIPSKFVAEEVDIDVSLFSLLLGDLDVDIEGVVDEGTFTGSFTRDARGSTYAFEVSGLPLYAVPKARQAFNAPMFGTFEMKLELDVPEHKFVQAEGFVEISCTACRIGDGETLLYVPGAKGLMGKGVTIPEIDLGSLKGKVDVAKGKGVIDGAIETNSEDIAMSLGGSFELKDPFRRSRFDLVLKMVVSDTLQERSEPIRLMVQTAHKNARLDPPEKGLGFRLTGPVSRPRFTGIKTKTREERLRERRDSARKRAERRRKRKKDRDKKKKKKEEEAKKKADAESEAEPDEAEQEAPPAKLGEPIQIEPVQPGAGVAPAPPSSAAPQPMEQPAEQPVEQPPQTEEEAPQPAEGEATGQGGQQEGQTGAGQTGEAEPARIVQ